MDSTSKIAKPSVGLEGGSVSELGGRDWAYSKARAERDKIEADVARCGAVLRAFPTVGPLGLTPDSVKAAPEYRSAKIAYDAVFARLREFNASFTKLFADEIRAERHAKAEGRA